MNARTHNLRGVTCAFPVGALTVVTGPSGSGKSSLAFDTLYAEGQRRFVESMSTYARQYLERLERPDVDEITHVLPAIAIEQKAPARSARSTIGTATEIHDVLRLLFSAAGTLRCPDDGSLVRRETPETVRAALVEEFGEGARLLVIAPRKVSSFEAESAEWRRLGFFRYVGAAGDVLEIPSSGREKERREEKTSSSGKEGKGGAAARPAHVAAAAPGPMSFEEIPVPFPLLVGRHVLSASDPEILSSLSMAFDSSDGEVRVLVAGEPLASARTFRRGLACNACGRAFADPVPALFSFNSPRGACEACEGFGRIVGIDAARVIPDVRKTLRERPIAPFNSPSYESAYDDLKAASRRLKLRWDVPWVELTQRERDAVWKGSGDWYGVEGLFKYLERKRYKVHVRVLLARYRGYTTCPACRGARLRPEALAVTVGGQTIARVCDLTLDELLAFLGSLPLRDSERERAASLVDELTRRAKTLVEIGLGYLTLARTMRTLSGGEAQRVQLGSAIGNALTGTLYVLDEPTVGLHSRDTRTAPRGPRAPRGRGQRRRRGRARHRRHPRGRPRHRPRAGGGGARREARLRGDAGGADGGGHGDREVVEEGEGNISAFGRQAVRAERFERKPRSRNGGCLRRGAGYLPTVRCQGSSTAARRAERALDIGRSGRRFAAIGGCISSRRI